MKDLKKELFGLSKVFFLFQNPIDWDAIYANAADILDFFQSHTPPDDAVDTDEDEELDNGLEADPNTKKRLRILYQKFAKWRNASPHQFFNQDFDKAKKAYDSALEAILMAKNAILPQAFPDTLTRRNFRKVYDFLEQMENVELERRRMKKERFEQRHILKARKLRRCMDEELKFQFWMVDRQEEQIEKRAISARCRRAVDLAYLHSKAVIEDFERRIRICERNGNADGADHGGPVGVVGTVALLNH